MGVPNRLQAGSYKNEGRLLRLGGVKDHGEVAVASDEEGLECGRHRLLGENLLAQPLRDVFERVGDDLG